MTGLEIVPSPPSVPINVAQAMLGSRIKVRTIEKRSMLVNFIPFGAGQFQQGRTGWGVVVNTSFNVRGEPMVCSPDDALNMFYGSDLKNLALGDFLVQK